MTNLFMYQQFLNLFVKTSSPNTYNGYMSDFQVYTRKDGGGGGVPETNLDGRVVLDLMDPILNLGHHVYCDRFLPSPDLFLKLWEKATVACGIVKANPKGMPKNLVQVKLKNQGNSLIQQKGNLVDSVWKDKRKLKKIPVADRPRQIFLLFLPLIVNNYQFLAELYSMKTQGVVPCVSLLLLTTLYPEL